MSSTTGTVKNLSDSRVQALQALISSVSGEGSSGEQNDASKLTTEQIRNLSQKLDEILGKDTEISRGKTNTTERNEKGELVNEEGLPIIDISEPVPATEPESQFVTASNLGDDLLPPWALSPAEKERRKAERERILDMLEEEERIEQERDAAAAREKWRAELGRRKEAGKAELEKLKKAKELQRKMGRALIRSVVEHQEIEGQAKPDKVPATDTKSKKSVSFAEQIEEPEPPSAKRKAVDWGDVAPGRLRPSKSQLDQRTMKMHVVERTPGAPREPPRPEATAVDDSDNESVPETYDSEEEQRPPPSDTEDEMHGEEDGSVEWDEEDLDLARHQREVALAYYEKRQSMAAEVSAAMKAHSHENDDEWDQPEVPLEATLASAPRKGPVSKFKASLINRSATTTMASHSLGQAVLPASHSSSLKSAIRMGKLEDGKLVGGEAGESDEELEAEAKAIIELLQKGEVTNIRPGPLSSQSALSQSPAAPTVPEDKQTEAAMRPEVKAGPTAKPLSKVSRFKAARGATPSSARPRSSESMDAGPSGSQPKAHPITVPTPLSRPPSQPLAGSVRERPPHNFTPSNTTSNKATGLPSFRIPANMDVVQAPEGLTPESFHPVNNPFSNVVDSPSFLPSGMSGVVETPTFQSTIIDPSARSRPTGSAASKPQTPAKTILEKHPAVMAAEVKESKPINREKQPEKKQRVSRFLAERT